MKTITPKKNCNTFKLTNGLLDGLPPSESREHEVSDSLLSGFKAVINRQGSISFLYRYTFNKRKRSMKVGSYPAMSLTVARKTVLELKRLQANGIDPQEQRDLVRAIPTFEQFCVNEYLPVAKAKKRSFKDDTSKLRLYIYPFFGSMLITEIGRRDIEAFLQTLIDRSLSKASVNRYRSLISVIFSMALEHEIIEKNPCRFVTKYPEDNLQTRFLSNEELGRFVAVLQDTNPETREQNSAVVAGITLLLLTGVRREEAFSARWEHFSFDQKIWFLPHTHTKAKKSRNVHLSDDVCALLQGLPNFGSQGDVFVNPKTGVRVKDPRRAFLRILKRAGIENFKIHSIRHTFASLAVSQNVSLFIVQGLLGHSSPAMTQRYAHISGGALQMASQKVANLVASSQSA